MTQYIKRGTSWRILKDGVMDMRDTLPVGVYTIKQVPMSDELYLDSVEPFVLTGKIYGNSEKLATRILTTLQRRETSTGVLLSGEKGSGKTMLTKLIALKAHELGMSCILVSDSHHGDNFNEFVQNVQQPAIFLFDEFEKVYDKPEQQEGLLSLLDGTFPTKKLFLFTVNNSYKVNENMINRPGRIYYHIHYRGLDEQFVREYAEDVLKNKDYTKALVALSYMYDALNFDMLKAIVEEMNATGEGPMEVVKILNASPYTYDKYNVTYTAVMKINGVEVPVTNIEQGQTLHKNPVIVAANNGFRAAVEYTDMFMPKELYEEGAIGDQLNGTDFSVTFDESSIVEVSPDMTQVTFKKKYRDWELEAIYTKDINETINRFMQLY